MQRRLLLLVVLIGSGCATTELPNPRFADPAQTHRTIAVLPFEMVFQGRAPRGMDAQQILTLETRESLAFQTSFHERLHRPDGSRRLDGRAATHRGTPTVGSRITGSLPGDSWEIASEDLAAILGVEAVIRIRIEKTRYLSDGASFGIDVGTFLLAEILDDDSDGEAPRPPFARSGQDP